MIVKTLRDRFLGTASFLLAPNDPPAGGNDGAGQDQNAGDNDTGGDDGKGKTTVLKEDVGAEDDAGAGDDAGGADDDDSDLADLPPEARAKAKAAIEKRLAREVGWRDRQIDRLYRKNREKDADNQALETIADPARRPAAQAQTDPNRKFTQAEVQAEARKISAQDKYDNDANDADARGKAVYGNKWGSTLAKLPKLGGVDVTDMVDILNTDQPHVVLYQLSDPDTYQRVMDLPPARRRNEFVKLSLKEAPKRIEESKRPAEQAAPVAAIAGGRRVAASQVDLYDEKVEDDAWYAARNASRRKKFTNVE